MTISGNLAFVLLDNGNETDNLDDLRYHKFLEKTASQTAAVEPQSLPPTSTDAKYHSLRVYQQIQVWLGHEQDVPPQEWGWKVVDGRMCL